MRVIQPIFTMRLAIFVNIFFLCLLLQVGFASAQKNEVPNSLAIDNRLQNLYRQVRCPACPAQPIAESEATVSRILREELKRKLASGESDEEALAWLVERYGEGILLRPSYRNAAALWIAPLLLACVAFLVLRARTSKKSDLS